MHPRDQFIANHSRRQHFRLGAEARRQFLKGPIIRERLVRAFPPFDPTDEITRNAKGKVTLAFPEGFKGVDTEAVVAAVAKIVRDLS